MDIFSSGFRVAVETENSIVPMHNLDEKGGIVTKNNITKTLQLSNITIVIFTVHSPIFLLPLGGY